MAENLLEVRNISVTFKTRYGILKALDNLSLNVKKGEILGLVGESGAGKSMTGAAILGLIDAPGQLSSGEIFYKDECISDAPETVRGHEISMIFQDPLMSLNPLRKIGDQLVETILTHMNISKSEAIKKAKNGLKEVGIDPSRLNSYPHTFSGGMRQRVVIALALAPEPSLIIADEPTTALDVSVQAQILDLLKKLCKERGTSIILVTHDMGVIAETTDRVGVLYAGRLAEIGNTREVLTDPKHPYTKGLVESTPRIDSNSFQKTLFQIPGSMPKLDAMPSGCAFHPRCEFSSDICTKKIPPMLRNRSACWLLDDGEL
tara:strand:- start:70 stop:1023 length:954 start_codon:yes stop_codon:yes gene_type:complete